VREHIVVATAGIHPHEAGDATDADLERLHELAANGNVVAIGEIGFDFHYEHSPCDVQARIFERQLELADTLRLPVVIHSRDADAETFAALLAWSQRRRASGFAEPFGVMHCYAYGPERLQAYIGLGLYVSISGIVTYPKAEEVQRSAALAPADALILETDCPYLAPQSRRGRRNEPALVRETADRVAALRGTSVGALAAQTCDNAIRLYRLDR
jgi:TatD DNase family protein